MAADKLSARERSLRARIGGLRLHALHDTRVVSAPGRVAAAAKLEARLLAEVDPDGLLSSPERTRRVELARRAHFASLAYKSARARSQKTAPSVSDASAGAVKEVSRGTGIAPS